MPITVEILDSSDQSLMEKVFSYFTYVDQKFSTFKTDSEINRINRGEVSEEEYSADMREILLLAEQTKKETNRFFDIRRPQGGMDPSGIVKGWAIHKAAQLLMESGVTDYFIDAGGDIQVSRPGVLGLPWKVGIQNPFNNQEVVKVLNLRNEGLATSGTYNKGSHIYNPKASADLATNIVSFSVVAKNIYEADRFATAAFAMGADGIYFIEKLPGFEAYQIDEKGTATFTSGFNKYTE